MWGGRWERRDGKGGGGGGGHETDSKFAFPNFIASTLKCHGVSYFLLFMPPTFITITYGCSTFTFLFWLSILSRNKKHYAVL